jgi:GT2 family glycosyltransferase
VADPTPASTAAPVLPKVGGRVSIVVLNWNSGELGVLACRSARQQHWPDIELVVVDNASTDDSLELIRAQVDTDTVVENHENLMFGPGMNSGIAVCTGEFIVALNCDAELEPDYVRNAVEVLRMYPRTAVVGGQVDSERVGASGPLAITATMRTQALALDRRGVCDKVNGACPVYRATALQQVIDRFGGPYDETYGMYGEDVDIALTLRRLGWDYRYEPTARASHVRSYGSAPKIAQRSGALRISTLANRHRNIARHHGRAWWAPTLLAGAQDAAFAVLRALKGDRSAGPDVLAGWRRAIATHRADRQRGASLADRRWLGAMETTKR